MLDKILLPEEEIFALIKLIYEAPGNDDRWSTLLARLASTFSAPFGTLDYYDVPQKSGNLAVSLGIDREFREEYERHYCAMNAWIQHRPRHIQLGMPVTGQMILADDELARTEFYRDFLSRRDIFHMMGSSLMDHRQRMALLSLYRSRNAEPFGPSDLSLFNLLLPHLKQALKLHAELSTALAGQRVLESALDRIQLGIFAVDASCRVQAMNATARELIEARDGLRLEVSVLKAAVLKETLQLRDLVAQVAPTSERATVFAGGVLRVSRSAVRTALHLRVAPAPRSDLFAAEPATALVFASDPESKLRLHHLASLYGLTPAEERFMDLLVQGETLYEAAKQLEISTNTGRTHLKKIFLKTGTKRQAELMRLLLLGVTAIREV